MIDIDRALRQMAEHIAYPETPDLAGSVLAEIRAAPRPKPRPAWQPTALRIAAAFGVVVLIVALIPAAREQVASWLGIRGVTIEDVPATTQPAPPPESTTVPSTVAPGGIGLDLGAPVTLAEAGVLAGFEPLVPSALGEPDAVFVGEGRIWFLYETRPGLPDTLAAGVGAIVAQFPFETTLGLTKQVVGGTDGAQFVEVDGAFGVWVEGPHELLFPELSGSAVDGRSAGNTLIWEGDLLTFRLETALTLDEAMAIAVSFE